MSLTDLRESLSAVSDAVPVPTPDGASFQRRVRRTRARRSAVRTAGVVVATAVGVGGVAVATPWGDDTGRSTAPADRHAASTRHAVPVVVQGHLRFADGGALGPDGPAVATIVGATTHGVVVLTDEGTLAQVDGPGDELRPLGPERVRTAYLDGDQVVYEDESGLVHGPEGTPPTRGRLMAAGSGMTVVAGSDGLVLHDGQGTHELFLDPDQVHTIHGVDAGSGLVAVRSDAGVHVFWDHGLFGGGLPGDRLGALAPDGHAYAWQAESRRSVELLDPRTLDATPVDGPSGEVSGVGWSSAGDLLVVIDHAATRTLWQCGPDGAGCAAVAEDPTGTLSLR